MSNRDRVALIIAAGLIGWGLVAMIALAWRNRPFTESGVEILGLIAGGLSASLAAYFATRNNDK